MPSLGTGMSNVLNQSVLSLKNYRWGHIIITKKDAAQPPHRYCHNLGQPNSTFGGIIIG